MANTDFIQATIEIFGAIITMVVAMIFFIITGNEKKSEKNLFRILLISGIALFIDAGWYIYDGNTSLAGVIINWFCNFSIFLCNPLMIVFLVRYVCNLILEGENKPNNIIAGLIYTISGFAMFIPISNLFYTWMYYIDELNIYHRILGWYIYTALNGLSLIVCLIMVFMHRKLISTRRKLALYIFLMAPVAGIALQALNLGISFIQIGTAIGSFGMLVSYLVEWMQYKSEEVDFNEEKKKLWIIESVFSIMILFVSASVISCVVSVNKVSNASIEQNSVAMAYMISETVDSVISEPVNVSRTMAQSQVIIDALSEDELEGSDVEKRMLNFMKRIKAEYGYQMIFVSSVKTKAYYTYDGLSRYMDVDSDPDDAWYNEFMSRGKKYELNVDTDKDNDMSLAVFVNMEVRDSEDNLIGICGVGMSLESLMDILAKYENRYSLDISLTNDEGLIQVDTDRAKVESEYIDVVRKSNETDGINYEKNALKAVVTKHLDEFGWYLVFEDNYPNKINVFEMVFPSLVIYVLGVILMLSFSFIFAMHERKRSMQLYNSKRLSETDALTGLKNRYALDKFIDKVKEEGLPEVFTTIMIDINGLKAANDAYGHESGDELIKGAAECLVSTFGVDADVYRIGGDEFVVNLLCHKEEAENYIYNLKKETEKWRGKKVKSLSLSVGSASLNSGVEFSIDELMKVADLMMYKNKNEYYSQAGNNRRRREN